MPQRSPKGDSTQRRDALRGEEPFSDGTVNADRGFAFMAFIVPAVSAVVR